MVGRQFIIAYRFYHVGFVQGNDSGISSSEVLDDCDLDEQSVPSFQNSFSTALLSGDCDMQHSVLVSTESKMSSWNE